MLPIMETIAQFLMCNILTYKKSNLKQELRDLGRSPRSIKTSLQLDKDKPVARIYIPRKSRESLLSFIGSLI